MDFTKTLEEVSKVFGDAVHGDFVARGRIKAIVDGNASLTEAISTSDLARTFNTVTRQALVSQYADLPSNWTQFAKRNVLEDFKPTYFREFLFADDTQLAENAGHVTAPGSLPVVPELTEYPTFVWTTSENQIQLHKNGARTGFSWEAVINDEWGFIQSLPGQLAKFAKNTEETEAVKVLASPTGPNSDTFNASNGNAADTAALSLDSLRAAKRAVRARKVNGNYVTVPKFALVVPTAMEDQARDILSITQLEVTENTADGTRTYKTGTSNSDVTLVVNDWLAKVDQSANAATTWYLVPLAGNDGTRDSILVNFLRNHEAPEFRQSGNTGLYLGGGNVPSLEGSLRNDDVEYRVRHVVAGGYNYAAAMYASTGTA